jgi:Co/Zn/Cd efflux system component
VGSQEDFLYLRDALENLKVVTANILYVFWGSNPAQLDKILALYCAAIGHPVI